jgi:membrane protein
VERLVTIVVATYRNWRDDRTVRLGAGLAYYGVFAVVPMLTLAAALVQRVFRRSDVQAYLEERLEAILGESGRDLAAAVNDQLAERSTEAGLGLLGAASLLFASSLVVLALQDAFNTIWKVPVITGVRTTLLRRARSLIVVVSAGALLAAGLLVHTAAGVLGVILPSGFAGIPGLIDLIELAGSWAVAAFGFTLLFQYMTPEALSWMRAFVVGAVTASAATVGTWMLTLYLNRIGGNSLTGVAGSALLILIWIFYQAQIVLAGCQLLKVLHTGPSASGSTPTATRI